MRVQMGVLDGVKRQVPNPGGAPSVDLRGHGLLPGLEQGEPDMGAGVPRLSADPLLQARVPHRRKRVAPHLGQRDRDPVQPVHPVTGGPALSRQGRRDKTQILVQGRHEGFQLAADVPPQAGVDLLVDPAGPQGRQIASDLHQGPPGGLGVGVPGGGENGNGLRGAFGNGDSVRQAAVVHEIDRGEMPRRTGCRCPRPR